jgi:hypothetical protein
LTASVPSGFVYLKVPEPSDGAMKLKSVQRSDGTVVPMDVNVWVTDRTFIGQGKRPITENVLHLFDLDSTGSYTLLYEDLPSADTVAPVSTVNALPATSPASFPVSWDGTDTGSGIAVYDIFASVNGGAFQPWMQNTRLTGGLFTGVVGNQYAFYCVATDAAGNRQSRTATADAETTVVASTPVITWANPTPITYGAALSAAELNATANVTGSFVYDPPAGTVLNAGNGQTLSVTFTPDLSGYSTVHATVLIDVWKAPLTITAEDKTQVYGAALPGLTARYAGFVNGDTIASLTTLTDLSTTAKAASGVGFYPIFASGAVAANYVITFANGTLTVTPASLTVKAEDAKRAYGSANPKFSAALSGFVNGDTPAVVSGTADFSTDATVYSPVGAYAIVPLKGTLSAANYQFGPFLPGRLTVAPASLRVIAKSESRAYGHANPAFSAIFSGFANGDAESVVTGAPRFSTSATVSSPVNYYDIVPALGTLAAANYEFGPFVNGTLTVTSASLTVTAKDESRPYGDANPAFSATISGFVNGDTASVVSGAPSFSTLATTSSPAGSYDIVPLLGTLSAPNYQFDSFVKGKLTVTSATSPVLLVTPQTVLKSKSTVVTFTLAVPPSAIFIPTSPNVQRQKGTTWTIAASRMYDDGTHGDAVSDDGIYTAQVELNEETTGSIVFRASVAYKGQIQRSFSKTSVVKVVDAVGLTSLGITLDYRGTGSEKVALQAQTAGSTHTGLAKIAPQEKVVTVSVPTVLGKSYVLEFTKDLVRSGWTPIRTIVGDGQVQSFSDREIADQGYYRVREE